MLTGCPASRRTIAEIRNDRDIYDLSRHLGQNSVKVTEIYLSFRPAARRVTQNLTQRLRKTGQKSKDDVSL